MNPQDGANLGLYSHAPVAVSSPGYLETRVVLSMTCHKVGGMPLTLLIRLPTN